MHSAALSHGRENALVREPHFRRKGRASARREAGVDPADGHGRKCTIVWLLVPWAQDILDAIESGRVNLDHYLLDQWRLMHIGAQPVPPSLIKRWLKYFPHHKYDTNYGLSESIGPGCVHLGVDNIEKSARSARPAISGRRASLTSEGTMLRPARSASLPSRDPAS